MCNTFAALLHNTSAPVPNKSCPGMSPTRDAYFGWLFLLEPAEKARVYEFMCGLLAFFHFWCVSWFWGVLGALWEHGTCPRIIPVLQPLQMKVAWSGGLLPQAKVGSVKRRSHKTGLKPKPHAFKGRSGYNPAFFFNWLGPFQSPSINGLRWPGFNHSCWVWCRGPQMNLGESGAHVKF